MKNLVAYIFAAALVSLSSNRALADFPEDTIRADAIAKVAFEVGLFSKLNRANATIINESFSRDAVNKYVAVILSETVSRTDVIARVLVKIPYSLMNAGGGHKRSITVEVKVTLRTDADSGAIKSRQVEVDQNSIREY